MSAYYNECDRRAVAWLRELIATGMIAHGHVDDRPIQEVKPSDLKGFTQCHFFAGIGGWSYALRLAGVPDDRPLWTGSCPCQPFSNAGLGLGTEDPRHLWPWFDRLICQCLPTTIFGEQVASKAALQWFDLVSSDLEASGYAVAAADLCAASVRAPNQRQRLFWVAHSDGGFTCHGNLQRGGEHGLLKESLRTCRVDNKLGDGRGKGRSDHRTYEPAQLATTSCAGFMAHTQTSIGRGRCDADLARGRIKESRGSGGPISMVDSARFWDVADWLYCRDGRWRPVEPRTFPLAHGIPARVGRLRGYGNAINPELAKEFIAAALEVIA